jgi:hypothetical protein
VDFPSSYRLTESYREPDPSTALRTYGTGFARGDRIEEALRAYIRAETSTPLRVKFVVFYCYLQ